MSSFVRDLPFGATLLGEKRTRFRLWAPAKDEVSSAAIFTVVSPDRAFGGIVAITLPSAER